MRISDWSSDVCYSDLDLEELAGVGTRHGRDVPDNLAAGPVVDPHEAVVVSRPPGPCEPVAAVARHHDGLARLVERLGDREPLGPFGGGVVARLDRVAGDLDTVVRDAVVAGAGLEPGGASCRESVGRNVKIPGVA